MAGLRSARIRFGRRHERPGAGTSLAALGCAREGLSIDFEQGETFA